MSSERRAGLSPLFTWRSAVTDVDSGLESSSRLVALVLSLYMSEAGSSAFPSADTLAQRTGLSRSTVRTHLDRLEETGWLAVSHQGRRAGLRGGRCHPNVYEARIPEEEVADDRPLSPEKVADGGSESGRLSNGNRPAIAREGVMNASRSRPAGRTGNPSGRRPASEELASRAVVDGQGDDDGEELLSADRVRDLKATLPAKVGRKVP
jgi:DNA-binding transcriptional ArsR family regulator